jgi:hypothetical protein
MSRACDFWQVSKRVVADIREDRERLEQMWKPTYEAVIGYRRSIRIPATPRMQLRVGAV